LNFWNKIDVHDDNEDLNASIQFMKNVLEDPNMDLDEMKVPWKKTLVQRRNFIRDHTTKEVLHEFPGYRYALLVSLFCIQFIPNKQLTFSTHTAVSLYKLNFIFKIFDEIQYVCSVDIEQNFKSMLPKLLDVVPDNTGFVDGK